MEVLVNLLFEPKAELKLSKKKMALKDKSERIAYFIEFNLIHGPTTIILSEEFAEVLKEGLVRASSGLVLPPQVQN